MTKKGKGKHIAPSVTIETETETIEIPQTLEVQVHGETRYSKKVWMELRRAANNVSTGLTAKEFAEYLDNQAANRAEKTAAKHSAYSNRVAAHLNDCQQMSERDQSRLIVFCQNDGRDCKVMKVGDKAEQSAKLREFANIAKDYATLRELAKDTGISLTEVVSQSPWSLHIFDKGTEVTFPRMSAYHKIGLKSLANCERIVNAFEFHYQIQAKLR